jgi:hypothetical protein
MPLPIRRKPWRGYPSANVIHGIRLYVNMAPPAPENPMFEANINVAMTVNKPVHVGTIPRGALILPVQAVIPVLFNGTTPALTLGTDDDPDGIATAAQLAIGTAGYKANLAGGALLGRATEDIEVMATLTGTGITAGEADILVPFYINQD